MFRRLVAPLGTIALLAIVVRALIWASGPSLRALRSDTATFDETLGGFAAVGAWLLVAWVALVLVGTTLSALPGVVGRASSRIVGVITPLAARRTARLALGLAVAAAPVALSAGPAMAYGQSLAGSGVIATDVVADSGDLPLIGRPTRPDQTPRPAGPLLVETSHDGSAADRGTAVDATAVNPSAPAAADVAEPDRAEPEGISSDAPAATSPVTVLAGDTLWAIAARHLEPGATDAQIAAEWPRWYEANRDAVGDDPDLIVPGTELTPPTP